MNKTINLETFNRQIKVETDGGVNWIFMEVKKIPIKTILIKKKTAFRATIKEVDGTEPLGPNERWMGIEEFIEKTGNEKIISAVLKKFIKMGYTIKMEKPKNKKIC